MENTATTAPASPKERNRFLWLMAGALIAATVFGAAWGLLRPAQSVTVVEGGMRLNADTLDAGFVGLLWAAVAAVVLGVALALISFFRMPERRGAATLWWITLIAAACVWIATGAGDVAAAVRQPDLQNAEIGDALELLPMVSVLPVVLYSAFSAAIVYWVCLLFTQAPDEPAESVPTSDLPEQ